MYYSGAPRAKRACGAPWINKSTPPRKFGNHVTDRATDRPSAPQAYQCLLSHFLATLGARRKLIAHQCCHQQEGVINSSARLSDVSGHRDVTAK